jgi:NAD dependent epimerase/dehydratase family enzyme
MVFSPASFANGKRRRSAGDAGIRVVNSPTGVVISGRGGMLSRLLTPFKLGLGARSLEAGNG